MAAFQFRLDRVLEWYRTQLQVEQSRLGLCLAALSLVEGRIARLQAERLAIEREVLSGGTILASDLASLGDYRARTNQHAARMEEDRVGQERALSKQRAAALSAQRRVRLIEKLRDRRLAEYRQAEGLALENLSAEAYLAKWMAAKCSEGERDLPGEAGLEPSAVGRHRPPSLSAAKLR